MVSQYSPRPCQGEKVLVHLLFFAFPGIMALLLHADLAQPLGSLCILCSLHTTWGLGFMAFMLIWSAFVSSAAYPDRWV
jgi:hypothetical protein